MEEAPARVLVVDDDPHVCLAFKRTLAIADFLVSTADSCDTAIGMLRAQTYNAIVSDIFLGERDGISLLEEIQKSHRDTPVILVTGMPTVESASAAVRLNAYEYLTKPVEMGRLRHVVAKAVELNMLRVEKHRIELENQQYQRDLESLIAARTEKLLESNLRYQLLFENSKDAIFMASWEGRFLSLNQAAVQLFGYDHGELLQNSTMVLCADAKQYRRFQEEMERKGYVKDFSVQFKRKDGSIIDCLLTANLLAYPNNDIEGFQGIIRDITPQKLAELKIRDQNAFLNNVIESLAHPFMVIDAANYEVVIANAAARNQKEQTDGPCYQMCHEYEVPCSRVGRTCPLEEVVRTRRPVHLEHEHDSGKDNLRQHETHAFPLFDEEGQVKQVIKYCIDVTDKKRLEAVAEAANLMENLGFIFSGIRHEIGNPINSIKMALSVLANNLDHYPIEKIREFVDRAMGEIYRVEYLLKALRSFSMYETPEVEPVKMEQFMRHFLSLVEKDFSSKGITINSKMAHHDIVALVDQRVFHQVMLNLLTNAADALENEDQPCIDIVVDRLQGCVQVRVADNGLGISESEQRNLFRPFFTSKPHGTGLGLVIVKKMISKMDGTVRIYSKPGEGTTVTMTFPKG